MCGSTMTPKRGREIDASSSAIDKELSDLADGKVMRGIADLAVREGELLEEQDALEFELGEDYFKTRDAGEASI
jgi:hypothetical protein